MITDCLTFSPAAYPDFARDTLEQIALQQKGCLGAEAALDQRDIGHG